jgi:hypothetical protein
MTGANSEKVPTCVGSVQPIEVLGEHPSRGGNVLSIRRAPGREKPLGEGFEILPGTG